MDTWFIRKDFGFKQCICLFYFFRYVPLNTTFTGAANLPNMEDTSVFALSGFQYIIMAIVITKGYPYKKPLFYNGEIVSPVWFFFAVCMC